MMDNAQNESKRSKSNNEIKNILVCVTQQKNCERLINKAVETKTSDETSINVLHVAKENLNIFHASSDSEVLEYLFNVSKAVGANLTVIKSNNTIQSIIKYVYENNIDCVILGKPAKKLDKDSTFSQLMGLLPDIPLVFG